MKNRFRSALWLCLGIGLAALGNPGTACSETHRDGMVALSHNKIKKAVQIWTALAEKGDILSQSSLAQVYAKGAGKAQKADPAKAAFWYEKCESELVVCQLGLANLYNDGIGIKKDPERAADLYRKVLATRTDWPEGINEARVNLGLLYYTGELGKEKKPEAQQLFRLAANEGVATGQFWLATTHESSGTPEDLIEAAKWYILAMEGDDVGSRLAKIRLISVEEKLTKAEIETARRLARSWRPQPHRQAS